MPVPPARPADVLAGRDDLTRQDERVDVPVPEVADARELSNAAGSRQEHGSSLHGVDAVSPSRWSPALGSVVTHSNVDAVVIDSPPLRIGTRIEERPADRMLPVARCHGPAAPRVAVDLR